VHAMSKRTLPLKVRKQTKDTEFNKSGDKIEKKDALPEKLKRVPRKVKFDLVHV
jgi:hypothetical protein